MQNKESKIERQDETVWFYPSSSKKGINPNGIRDVVGVNVNVAV